MANLEINELYAKYENLRDLVGAGQLLEDFVQQMSSNQLQDLLDDAYTHFGFEFDDDLSEDEEDDE